MDKEAKAAGLGTYIVADAGHTQVDPGSLTVIAVGPGKGISNCLLTVCQA